jgi:endo-beta-N-acetylglucosaminidase D/PKD repeat protein
MHHYKKMIVCAVMLLASCLIWHSTASAKQPYSSYWFPNDLLNCSPDKDKDAAFNKSGIPLATRYTGYQLNPNATLDPKLVALSSMADHTSGNPSQGSDQFNAYAFQYWQYVDLLVDWAGSSGEGIIVPPGADANDSAHKNGVPILGTIFYPPTAYGGKIQWVNDSLVQNPDGSFPFADKLIEVAQYYGFDGWFVNQETAGGNSVTATKMQLFLKYLQAKKPDNMKIMWYDSMIKSGPVSWQGALNANNQMFFQDNGKVADSMFLDFRWSATSLKASNALATSLARSPYDLFAGVDVEANGYNTNARFTSIFPSGSPAVTSLGLYRPDWAYKSSTGQADYYARENRFWVGPSGDPRKTVPASAWPGIANYISDKTPITSLPFVTNFNTGQGNIFAVNGDVLRNKDWNNRSLQDVMPTWRWIAESPGVALKPDIDFTTAYYGGSSIKVSGDLSPANATQIKLYKTDLLVGPNTELGLTYKLSNPDLDQSHMQIGISFSEDPNQFVFLNVGNATAQAWNTKTIPIGEYQGKRIAAIALNFTSDTVINGYTVNIGQLSVKDAVGEPSVSPQLSGPSIENDFTGGILTDARILWTKTDPEAALFEIYRIKPDGSKEFLGATPNSAYYVPEIKRIGKETQTTLEIIGVDKYFRHSAAVNVMVNWPEYPKPTAKFSINKRYVAPGAAVELFDQSSETTESVAWEFPGGSVDYSSGHPVVSYDKEGTYTVTLTAKNSSGEDKYSAQIHVTWAVSGDLSNLSLNKPATADSTCAASEVAKYAFDGNIKTKWCANAGNGPHWVISDLGASYAITDFIISHAEIGGEAVNMNTQDYKIQISSDKVTWNDVVDMHGNTKGITKDSIELKQARYVRLWITKPTSTTDSAARIYEFEVDGYTINPLFQSINNSQDVIGLRSLLESPDLHLNLKKYNLLNSDDKNKAVLAVLNNKPLDGYFSSSSIQEVLDQAFNALDQTAPETTIHASPAEPDGHNGWYVHPIKLELMAIDNLSGVAMTEYSFDGGINWQLYSDPITLNQETIFTFSYRTTDNAGNIEATKESSFKLDMVSPTVTSSVYAGEIYTDAEDLNLEISVTDDLSGADLSMTAIMLDGVMLKQGETLELYKLPLGSHTLNVTASDFAGNPGNLNVEFQTTTSIDSLRTLVTKFRTSGWIDNDGIANSLQKELEAGSLNSFINEVEAQSGKHISSEAAAYLLRDADFLLNIQK